MSRPGPSELPPTPTVEPVAAPPLHEQLASEHLLVGRIKDERGNPMTPTHAQKGSRRYRYYVSQAVLQGKADRGSVSRLPAPEIEAIVVGALRAARCPRPSIRARGS